MGWDSNIEATRFKGKLPLQSFNQLQAALRERCLAASLSVPSIFASDISKMTDMLPPDWFTVFQSTMTTLIYMYVNHADNNGNWSGQSTIPEYTPTTMLAAIGDSVRLPAPSAVSHRGCAAWCYQQYKMLNKMRWRKKYYEGASSKTKNKYKYPQPNGYYNATTEAEAFNGARIAFDASQWVDTPSQYQRYFFGQAAAYSTGSYSSYISAAKRLITLSPIGSLRYSIDQYVLPLDGWLQNYPSVRNSYGWASWRYLYLILDTSIPEISSSTELSLPHATPSAASFESNFWGTAPRYSNGNFYLVLKFDGANGFQYRNW